MLTQKKPSIALSREIRNDVLILLDMRYTPPKYIGLIKPRAFDKGYYNFSASVRSRLYFDCLRHHIPVKFRSLEKAWDWTAKYAICYKETKYTIFNPLMKWSAYAPNLFYYLTRLQIQLILLKIVIGSGLGIFMCNTENEVVDLVSIILVGILGLMVMTDLGLFIHKWRSGR